MISYTLHAGLIIAGCCIFYKILLRKETFFRLNRWMLALCLLLAFTLPLIPVPQQWSLRSTENTVETRLSLHRRGAGGDPGPETLPSDASGKQEQGLQPSQATENTVKT